MEVKKRSGNIKMDVTKDTKKRETRQFIVINEEKLITDVRNRPILYDKSLKGYRKPTIRENAWQEVANNLNSTVDECKKRWRSLRDAFMKQYKLLSADESLTKKKKWLFFHQMEFLAPYLDLNLSTIDLSFDEYYHDAVKKEMTKPEHDFDPKDIVYETSVVEYEEGDGEEIYNNNQIITETLNITDNEEEQYEEITGQNSNTSQNVEVTTISYTNDPDEKFLLSCSSILKRLSNKQNTLARLKIQEILYKIEFGDK